MEPTIRPATGEDLAGLLLLWAELMELHARLDPQFRLAPDAAGQAEAHLRLELALPTSLCLVAELDGRLVGYCRASVRQRPAIFAERAHGFVSEFHVRAAFRRRGIGRGLFARVRQWLAGQGVHRVELVTLDANHASGAFWREVGCEPFAARRFLELGRV